MPYYVYIQPDGFPSIVESELNLKLPAFNEWFLLEVKQTRPDYSKQRYVNGSWVWGMGDSENKIKRRSAMSVLDLMDDLHDAMVAGEIPKAKKFFNRMENLKKKFPDK